jgi:hypothetical protein
MLAGCKHPELRRRHTRYIRMNLGMGNIAGPCSNSVFGPNIVFATFSKPFPTLSGTIQSVLVF